LVCCIREEKKILSNNLIAVFHLAVVAMENVVAVEN